MQEPIRILHVVTYMGRGGLETMIMNYYRHIDRSKIQFDFLVHRDFEADYDAEITSLGGYIYHLPRLVPWSITYKRALSRFFQDHPEYRVVHVHQDCLSSVILKAAKRQDIPVRIAHSHNNNQDKNLKYLIKLYYRSLIPKYATDLLACSDEAGRWMFRKAPYQILNNAIESENYIYSEKNRARIRHELNITDDAVVIGHVGRFAAQKNHTFLIDIFAEIKERRKDAKLLLVGDGELRRTVKEKIENLNLGDSVIFAGAREDVAALMHAMDIFVFPSQYEGLGIVAIEAQAAGLPCILSDTVSDAAMITGLAQKVSLKESAAYWASVILRWENTQRGDTSQAVKNARYDVESNTAWLESFYLDHWRT